MDETHEGHRPLWKVLLTDIYWLNLLNPRMWMSAGFTAILAGIPAVLIWEPLAAPVVVTVFFAMLALMSLNPPSCPHCRKRVKIGATTCRGCGQQVQPTSAR